MMKKYACKVLAAAMAVSMMVPGVNALAATTASGNKADTNVKYDVTESYTWSVPTTIDFTNASDATVTTNESDTVAQNVKVTKNIIANNKKLHIILDNSNTFKISSTEGATLDYTVKVGNNDTALNAGGTVLDVNAGTNEGSATLKFELKKDSVEKAGNYTGTLSYVSSVVAQ